LSDGNFSACRPAASGANAAAVAACAAKSQAQCTGDCLYAAYGESTYDECEATLYAGASYDSCSAPEHRLCSGEPGTSGASISQCTLYRQNFLCPDHSLGSNSTAFNCTETNPYWVNDYTCGCAYTDGRYDAATEAQCGTSTVFLDTTSEPDTLVTNYDMTLFLESSSTTRTHICGLIGSPADCTRSAL
jgi:hypothetical protein